VIHSTFSFEGSSIFLYSRSPVLANGISADLHPVEARNTYVLGLPPKLYHYPENNVPGIPCFSPGRETKQVEKNYPNLVSLVEPSLNQPTPC
jgi:hypothetical protein